MILFLTRAVVTEINDRCFSSPTTEKGNFFEKP